MNKVLLSFGIMLIFGNSVFAQSGSKTRLDLPVTKQKLIQVLKENEIKEADIIYIIRQDGVDFVLTPEVESELKAVSASTKLLAAIRQNQRLAIGVANSRAINLVTPAYPSAARAIGVSGSVNVLVAVDEDGNVTDVHAISGHPLLRPAAEEAALASKFSPIIIAKKKRKATGVIIYNFVPR